MSSGEQSGGGQPPAAQAEKHAPGGMQGAAIEFRPGTVIFQEGDPGGDLFFIKDGEVEVFKTSGGGVEVGLAILKAGEVLGVMTCLTREPRLASARAKSHVKAVVVKQSGVKTLISSTPPWVTTVMKDFILRIRNMDDLYANAVGKLDRMDRDVSIVAMAAFVANGLHELGDALAPGVGDDRVVDIDQVLGRLDRILSPGEGRIEGIFNIFIEVGWLKSEPKVKSRRASLSVLARLKPFSDLAAVYLSSPDYRTEVEALTNSDCASLIALTERARARGLPQNDEVSITLTDMPPEKAAPESLKSACKKAASAGLLRLESRGQDAVFIPNKLLHSVRALVAIQKLRALEKKRAAFGKDDRNSMAIITENF